MYKYNPINGISSQSLTFTTPEGTVTLSKQPTNITETQLEYLKENYSEFVACLEQKIIESVEPLPPASSPKRR